MCKLHTVGLGLGLALAALGSAQAAPVVGSGGGYFGTANYGNGAGSVVGPYSTWIECNNALQAAITNAVNNFGYTLVSMNPCSYTPPFSGVMYQHFELAISDKDGDSVGVATVLLDEVKRIREAHRADAYDAAVGELVRITDPELGRITDPNDENRSGRATRPRPVKAGALGRITDPNDENRSGRAQKPRPVKAGP